MAPTKDQLKNPFTGQEKAPRADVLQINPMKLLENLRAGTALYDLAEELQRVVTGIRNTGGAGSVTLKLIITPADGSEGDQVVIRDEINSKIPRKKMRGTLMFTTDKGGLQREDPNQMNFEAGLDGKKTE